MANTDYPGTSDLSDYQGYSTSYDLRRFLPRAVVIEGENPTPNPRDPRPESLTLSDIQYYISRADSQINSILGSIYDTPFCLTNIDGHIKYPDPISFISAVLASWMIFQQRLSGSERAAGEYTERMYKIAMSRMDDIINGRTILRGQNSYRSHRTINSDLFSAPPRTSKDPSDMGKL